MFEEKLRIYYKGKVSYISVQNFSRALLCITEPKKCLILVQKHNLQYWLSS